MEEPQNTHLEETGLADELNQIIEYTPATTGQRFINWLVDNLLMRFGLSWATGTLVGKILVTFFPEYTARIVYEDQQFGDLLLIGYAIGICNYLVYYTFCEKLFKGYTLGKLFTGTRAIREDGQELTLRNAFLRTLSRLVPFEAFSGFGDKPWHDSWTKTMVVKAR
jgi:uncharacterized RDD family membrane protein YckC